MMQETSLLYTIDPEALESTGAAGHGVQVNPDSTRDRIMAAAMELVAMAGIRATTVRDITQAADVNLAAVNYHYGSKVELLNQAIMRILLPVNLRRVEMLNAKPRDPATGAISVEDILDCLFRPIVECPRAADGSRMYLRALQHYRTEVDPRANQLIRNTFDEAGRRFVDEFAITLPHLNRAEIIWRYELARGGVLHTLTVCEPAYLRKRQMDAGAPLLATDQIEAILKQLVQCYLPSFLMQAVWRADQLTM